MSIILIVSSVESNAPVIDLNQTLRREGIQIQIFHDDKHHFLNTRYKLLEIHLKTRNDRPDRPV